MRVVSAFALLPLVACTDPEEPPVDPPVRRAVTVQLDTRNGPPAFVAVRDGDEAWQPLATSPDHTYSFEVANAYAFAVVCSGTTKHRTVIAHALATEGTREVSCDVYDDLPATVAVTGQMMQPGQISLYDSQSSTTAPWNFTLDVPPSTYDLFAFGSDRALITRDIDVSGAMTLPPIDISGGTPYDFPPVTIAGKQADETAVTQLVAFTANSFALAELPGSAVRILPESLLVPPFDMQFVSAAVRTDTTYRDIEIDLEVISLDGPVVTLELMPRLDGVTLASSEATWTTLPSGAVTYLVYADASNEVMVRATSQWAAQHTVLSAAIDAEGYLDTWRVPASATRQLTVSAPGSTASTSVIARN